MLIVFDVRDDLISPDQAAMLAQQSPMWVLCQEWRVIPLSHLDPIEEPEKPKTKPTKRTNHPKKGG